MKSRNDKKATHYIPDFIKADLQRKTVRKPQICCPLPSALSTAEHFAIKSTLMRKKKYFYNLFKGI